MLTDDDRSPRWADLVKLMAQAADRGHAAHAAAVVKPWLVVPVRLESFGGWLPATALVLSGAPEFDGLVVVTTRAWLDHLKAQPPAGACGRFESDREAAQYLAYEEFARRDASAAADLQRWRTVMAVEARIRRDA